MKKLTFPWIALVAFLMTRFLIMFEYKMTISDVPFYFSVAQQGLGQGLTAYKDFLWGYPPASLPLVYIPYLFSKNLEGYRIAFQFLCFFCELGVFMMLWKFVAERLKFSNLQVHQALLVYSVLGLFQGHLLYDRVDVLVLFSFVGCLYFFSSSPALSVVPGILGTLWKVTPLFWMPPAMIFKFNQVRGKSWATLIFVPAAVVAAVMFGWNAAIDGHLLKTLNLHAERGIQIESVWATPLMLTKAFNSTADVKIETNHGAQHLAGAMITPLYDLTSRYLGFGLLAIGYLHLMWHLFRTRQQKPREETDLNWLVFLALSSVTVLFMSAQRVLSIQFFIWLMPVLAIFLPKMKSPLLWVLGPMMFVLGYVGFDIGYWQFVEYDKTYVSVVAVRNILLIAFSGYLIFRYLKDLQATSQGKMLHEVAPIKESGEKFMKPQAKQTPTKTPAASQKKKYKKRA